MGLAFNLNKKAVGAMFLLCLGGAICVSWQAQPTMGNAPPRGLPPTAIDVGRALFNDANLSNPAGQSCASCHNAAAGFTVPDQKTNLLSGIAQGAVKGRFENRCPPTISYAAFLPQGPPHFEGTVEAFIGGLFWDGHAQDLTDQVHYPIENPNEMNATVHNVGSPALVVSNLARDENARLFRQVYGSDIFSQNADAVFALIVQSIVAYEQSAEVSPFSSKYDAFVHGDAKLTQKEWNGLRLVTGTTTGRPGGPAYYTNAHCSDCHGIPSDPTTGPDLWTNSCYDNIGVPKNPNNPYYKETNLRSNPTGYNPQGANYVDLGLGGFFYPFQYNLPPGNIGNGNNGQGDFLAINGDFKAPTLRNLDKRPRPDFIKAYTHNGYFKDIKSIVHFYNTRNLTTVPGEVIDFTAADPYAGLQGKPLWPVPEYPNFTTLQNSTGDPDGQVGNLGLTEEEEADIVAFLKTLTDGWGKSYPVAAQAQTVTTMIAR